MLHYVLCHGIVHFYWVPQQFANWGVTSTHYIDITHQNVCNIRVEQASVRHLPIAVLIMILPNLSCYK